MVNIPNLCGHRLSVKNVYTWVKAGLKGIAISDLQGSGVTKVVSAILLQNPSPQAILKFHHLISLDYRA